MRVFTLALLLLIVDACVVASAQVVQQVNQVRVGGPLMMGPDDEQMQSIMRMEIDAIQRITGINDAAIKKLEVAAKSAIQSLSKKHQAQLQAQAQGFPQAVPPKPKTARGELSDEDAELKNPVNNPPFLPAINIFANSPEAVKKEEIWVKTIANVLNEEQSASYKQFLTDRQARLRQQAVKHYVEQLDSYLLLSGSQLDALTRIVDEKIGDDLAKQPINRMGVGGAMVFMVAGGNMHSLKPDDLSQVLSPTQLAEFKRQQDQMNLGPMGVLPGMPGAKPAKREAKEQNSKFNSNLGFTVQEDGGRLTVTDVKADSPADQAGLKSGDVIDSLDDEPIDTLVQLKRGLSKVGKTWQIQVRRNDQLVKVGNE